MPSHPAISDNERQRILITVKTYPELSTTYGETVCTAGIRPDGSWVRIYPVPFRALEDLERYPKFAWLNIRLRKRPASKDERPESYSAPFPEDFTSDERVDTKHDWQQRRRLILDTCEVHISMNSLIEAARENKLSLAVFKPTTIVRFEVTEADPREWPEDRVATIREAGKQGSLFDKEALRVFDIVRKVPYEFYYRFLDIDGKESRMRILDWEIGALFWNCLRDANGDEAKAVNKVRQKYDDEFRKKDLHFFLGTTLKWQRMMAPNPWTIAGVFPIPPDPNRNQPSLF